MKCSACSFEVKDEAKFCTNCGTSMSTKISCPHCGTLNDKADGFCMTCSKPMKSSASMKPASESNVQSDDFIFAVTEETVAKKPDANISTPWGYFMVVLQDGFVSAKACRELKADLDRNKDKGNLLSHVLNWLGLGKGGNQPKNPSVPGSSQVYFVMNAKDTPLVSFTRPTPVTGYPDAKLNFSFWLESAEQEQTEGGPDSNALGLFFQRCLGARGSLTIHEFKQLAIEQAEKLIPGFVLDSFVSDPASTQLIATELRKVTGISASCYLSLGKVEERIQLDISRGPARCPDSNCKKVFLKPMKFCTECGTSMQQGDSGVNQGALGGKMDASYLLSKEGEIITLRLSMLITRKTDLSVLGAASTLDIEVDDEFRGNVAQQVIDYLSTDIRQKTLLELMQPDMLDSLTQKLSSHLIKQFRGFITGFNVIDIRSATEDWFFQSEALIKEQLRILDSQKEQLRIDDAQLDLEEAAFAVALRRIKQEGSQELQERQAALEARLAETQLEVQEYDLETKTDLRKEAIDDEAASLRLDRESARRDQERALNRKEGREDRVDEVEGLDHDQGLEKRMVRHDLDVADMVGDAESRSRRRNVSDDSFEEEEKLRLRAKEIQEVEFLKSSLEEDIEIRRKDRKLDELAKLADIDAKLEQQKNDFELSKIQNLKGLSAQELLAMQAAELAKSAGGGDATANLIKAIADSQAATAGAGIKDEMYKQMLDVQKASMESAIQAHKEASQVAQSTNEKSMEAMSKVAEKAASAVTTSVAVKLGGDVADKEPKLRTCTNSACGYSWPSDKPIKFCEKCGTPASK